ncbi:MAG: site-specific integrase [Deltaproteobacteria bacterium]|nr:MAG: site-specific integrase [Deltaproteobacteria bacterium]
MHFPYLHQSSSYYYFRIRIPSDLLEWFDHHEIKRSLRTKNHQLAKSQAVALTYKAEQLFSLLRAGILPAESIPEYMVKHFPVKKGRKKISVNDFSLDGVVKTYVQEHVSRGKWSEKTRLENEGILNLFSQLIDIQDIRQISRVMMIEFMGRLKRIPAHMNKKPEFKAKNFREILSMQVTQTLGTGTVNKYMSRISSLFVWCVRQGVVIKNPAESLAIAKNVSEHEEREIYNREDIGRLLRSLEAIPEDRPERYWIPLIALYSGMRLEEICQLHTEDIVEIDSVWCFAINCTGDKKLKTLASKRSVPIHAELIQRGLLGYLEKINNRGDKRLWGNLEKGRDGYSHLFGKWYQRHNRKFISKEPKKCFHSFRHTFANSLKQHGVAENLIAEILGHKNTSITTGRYGKRYNNEILSEAINFIAY